MANLAQIQSIAQGQFFVKDSLGNLTELKVGDTVSLNDTIVAANSNTDLSKIEILFDTNELITLSQGEQLLDATLLASTFGNEELAFDKQEVDETLSAWNNTEASDEADMETAAGDVTEQATNAGDERAADGGALRSKFNSRTGDSTDVRSDLRDTSFGEGNPENPQEQIPTELLNPVGATTPVDTRVPVSVITLSDPTINEGNQITITATVTNAPQTDLIITLNNGQTITIPAGQTTSSVTFDNPNSEDVYIDKSTETYTITGTTGGNYVSLDTSDSSVVTIEDTEDTTTVKITGTDTTEGGKATFELELSNKPQTGTTVTGKVEVDGKSYDVTFDADGKATLTVDVKANDVYNGEPTLTAKVTEISGGNFEKVNPNAQTTITVKDTEDTTTVKITGTDTTEGGKATFELELSNKPQTGTTVTGKVEVDGKSYDVTFDADGKATLTVDVKANDVYNGEPTLTAKVTEISGGNFEKVNPNAQTTITVKDTEDTTTVKITGTDTTEGGKATFELELSNKPQTGTTVTGKVEVDGKSYDVTFDADGKATLTVDVKANDVYNGEPTLTAKVTEISGGNFEKVNPNAQTTITVKDTEDTTTVKITGTDTTEGGKATFELELSNKPQTGTTVTGKVEVDGKSYDVTFDADGKATLTVDVKANDVYNGEPTLTAKVTEISGGNFEKVNPNAQTTITVKDTEDTTTVKITGTDTTEGGKATFELELSNKPQTGTTVTGKVEVDGKSYDVTFDADGKATLTVDVKANDVYNGEPTLTAKVTEISGGNFEKVNPNAQTTITVKDTEDTTTVKITGTDTTEGGKATFELELSNKPQTGTTVTGKVEVDGKSYDVTFDADGKATLTVDVKANDVYNGEPTLTAKVTEISGGNFEKVNPNAQTTITVKDTEDTTTVKITGTDTTEGGKATFELELSNKPQTGTTVTGKVEVDGKSYDVTFDADGKATLTVDVKANDVYNGEPTLTAKVTEISGGNFEKVNPNAQTTITVKDTEDTTTVKITGTDTTEGGKATFELELSNKPQTGTTVTGKVEVDGKSYDVTFDADGKATLTVDVKANDVYNGEPTLTAKVTEISGGNFEKVNPNAQTTITVKDTEDTTTVTLTATAEVNEDNNHEVDGVYIGNAITYTAKLPDGVTANNAITVTLSVGANGEPASDTNPALTITIPKDGNSGTVIADKVNRDNNDGSGEDKYIESDSLSAKITGVSEANAGSSGSFENLTFDDTPAVTNILNDEDAVDVTITATVTTPKIIDVTTVTDGTTGVKVTGYNSDGKETDLSIIKGTNHDGFGVEGTNLSNGDTKELGVEEKIVVEFTDGKDVNSLDVSFAWRNNHETAKLTFVKDGQVVGYATVDGDGSSTTKAIVKYYDENNNLIKTQEAEGSSDRVDKAFTFELPDSNGGIVSFDKVEFSAPQNKDDYLINKIVYKEVLNPEVTDIVTNGGDITFNIQVDENYPPQGTATATVEVNGKEYSVELNSTGRGTLTIDSKELGDLSNIVAKVVKVEGGNYEKVNPTEASFNFTPTLKSTDDSISTDEDVSYTLKVTDLGEVSSNTKEFKITELPTNGKLFLNITVGDTIFNPDGTQTVATEDIKVEITKDQIVTLGQVGAGKVEFVPNKDTDIDSSFNFQVGDGNGKFSTEYTTTIDVKAVADAPIVSIDVTKIGATTIVVDGDTGNSNNDGNNSIGGIVTENFWEGYNSKEDIMTNSTHNENSIGWQNPFTSNSDNVDIKGNQTQWIDTQDGNDNVYISENAGGINTGNGDDRVFIKGNVTNNINLGSGNDELHIKGNSSTIDAGDGDDKVKIEGNANNDIQLGAGNDSLEIKGNASSISTGDGNDKIKIEGNSNGTIELGSGNNYLEIKGNATSIQVGGDSGNDRVIVNGNATNNISLGKGDDYLELGGKILNYVDGGEGNSDSVYLKGYTLTEYQALIANGNEWRVKNFENIKLGDGTIVKGDGSVFETSKPENIIKAVAYKVDISASLKDIDGSETLSVVIKNVPTGAVLESTKYDVSKNSDGSWSVNFKAGTTGDALLKIEDSLTMKVPQSYKGDINLQIEAKATETNDNTDGNNFATATANDTIKTVTIEPFKAELDMELSSATTNTITTKDVNKTATEQAGIKLGADGKYYETKVVSKTETVVDTEALKDLTVTINGKTYTGITVGADGKYYVIDNTIAKEQKTIEVEREVTKTVSLTDKQVESFMIEVTKETKGIVLGKEVTDLGKNDTITKNNYKTYTLEQPTSNIEIKLSSGSGKIEFVDSNGKVIGSSTTQSGIDSKGYSVPKDAVGVKITSTSTSLKIEAIKYHVDPHEETVQVGGKILDVEGMQKAGISWSSTVSEKQVQTQDITKLGSTVGDGNIKGFNPEAKANSQVFDFGKDKAFQKVIIEVDATISGTWNFNKDSTKDVFVVSANGVPQGAYNFSSNQDYSNQASFDKNIEKDNPNDFDVKYVNGTLSQKYTYEVYLDENGKAQMNFTVASTNTDEWVTITEVRATYDGLSGFVQTKTEIEKVTETIFVGVPTKIVYTGEVPTKEITKYETVQVETTPIYTKITQYEYELDLSASITVGSGELSIITLKDIPSGVTIKGYEANEDGSYTIKIGEDGKSQLTLVSDNLLNDADKESIKANISATSEDGHQNGDIEVNINGEISNSINIIGTDNDDDISLNIDNATSINIDGGVGYDTIKLEENNDIDFSNLGNLIKNIEAIDLTDGNHKLTNITLDDVLKMSGDDNKIKITGDEFDSVSFKNTISEDGKEQSWSKTAGEGVDKGFDIYVNSGDPTLQVKVEQPISDGITN